MTSFFEIVLPASFLVHAFNYAMASLLACALALGIGGMRAWSLPVRHAVLVAGLAVSLLAPVTLLMFHWPAFLSIPVIETEQPPPASVALKSAEMPDRQKSLEVESAKLVQSLDVARDNRGAVRSAAQTLPTVTAPGTSNRQRLSWTTREWACLGGTLLCGLWLVGISYGIVRAIMCLVRLRRWLRSTTLASSPLLLAAARSAPGQLRRRREIPIFRSAVLPAPIAVGLLRPRIVVPDAIESALSSDQLRAVMRHEMAHLERLDLWIGLLQQVGQIVYWWSPLMHMVNRRIALLREQICDDIALGELTEPSGYAATLINLAEQCGRCVSVPATLGIGVSPARQLERRIRRIVSSAGVRCVRLTRRASVGVSAVVLLMTGTILLAQVEVEPQVAKRIDVKAPVATIKPVVALAPAKTEEKSKSEPVATTSASIVAKELEQFQGTWCFDVLQLRDWPQPIGIGTDSNGRSSEKRWMVKGNQISWTSMEGERIYANFTIDPLQTPKQIDVTFLNGPYKGAKCLGIYEPQQGNGNYLWLCLTNPGSSAPRPTDVSYSSLKQQSMIGIYRVAAPPKQTAAKALEQFQGVWNMDLCDSTLAAFSATQEEAAKWQWTIKGDEILWSRQGEIWKVKLDVDPTGSPKEMDLTYLSGPFQGAKCLGMYEFGGIDGQSLLISMQDPGAKVERPHDISMSSSSHNSLIFLRPGKPSDTERELAAFQGTWTLKNFETDSWPLPIGKGPDKFGAGSELRWVIKGNEVTWTSPDGQESKAAFTLDPRQTPKQIDLTFLGGPNKGQTRLGVYQRGDTDGNVLWLCMADAKVANERPKSFSYQKNDGRSLLSLYWLEPPNPSAPK